MFLTYLYLLSQRTQMLEHYVLIYHLLRVSARGPLMVAQWLRYYATNRKVAGSIPDGVIGIFH
jgi:hypothetical protein